MNTTHLLLYGAFVGGWELILIAVLLGFTAFWIWMLVDCATYETSTGSKVAWILIILFASCVGAPVYYLARKLPRDSAAKKTGGPDVPAA
jgi:hypothetical protein